MSFWPARFALSLSAAVAIAYGQGVRRLLESTEDATPLALAREVARRADLKDPELVGQARKLMNLPTEAGAARLRARLRVTALSEGRSTGPEAAVLARTVKSEGDYRDPGVAESSNWLSRALDRLKNLLKRDRRETTSNINLSGLGGLFQFLMWGVLAVAVAAFGFFTIRHFQWRKRLLRRAHAVLDEDEPERTLDEWLLLADELESAGEYRRAVRALYLACLIKFDDARIARFDRGQTNWEHLARIEASPTFPRDLDFRTPTREFDLVWYGHQVKGSEDVERFRSTYSAVLDATQAVQT